jgi:IS30 family transposase
MRGYTQLTREQRYQIQALLNTQQPQIQIAAVIGVHPATISRELRRNRGCRGYRPHQAQSLAQARQVAKRHPRLAPVIWQQVDTLLRQTWSPEQICGRFQQEQGQTISHEWIDQHIYKDKRTGGDLYARCAVRRSGGNAMARIVDGDGSPITSQLRSDRRW